MAPSADFISIIKDIEYIQGIKAAGITQKYPDEVYIDIEEKSFAKLCFGLHQRFNSPVRMLFAQDERSVTGKFVIYCVFLSTEFKKWFFVRLNIDGKSPKFPSLAKEIYSASLFEREIKEMFGIEPTGNPDLRRLKLHDEVWPDNNFPLRKDFKLSGIKEAVKNNYKFVRIEGEGIFEVPVGPVHAGIIGPGHFRFSAAGEPIINLEARLGFTHKGVEKLFEDRDLKSAVMLSECISGDSAFSYSAAFCHSVEKILNLNVPEQALYIRGIFLELERMYNHVADIAGIAVDVGFIFPSMYASIIKENILRLNEKLSGSRYLKNINLPGGVNVDFNGYRKDILMKELSLILEDFGELKKILFSSASFMDRVDKTGILKKNTARDLGVSGLAARASGISLDLRKVFGSIYGNVKFNIIKEKQGDVLARLNVRCSEFEESSRLIKEFSKNLTENGFNRCNDIQPKEGFGLGYVESWRGPLLFWVALDKNAHIERVKIVDPSFNNWQGLCYAVLGNIIPDFPVCNKSFNLSYSGNDL